MKSSLLSVLLFCIITTKSEDADYYWKNYKGTIPEDALPAGKDANGRDTYIGQVYVHCHGLFVGQIVPGVLEVEVPCYGVKKRDYLIKILCTGHKNNFNWLPTTWQSFHMDTINTHAVEGGYDHVGNKGMVHIGRLMYQGVLKIGRVASHKVEDVYFYFTNKNREEKAKHFEVLIYNKSAPISSLFNIRTKSDSDRINFTY